MILLLKDAAMFRNTEHFGNVIIMAVLYSYLYEVKRHGFSQHVRSLRNG